MSRAPSGEEIWRDARWLAQALDPRAGLVRLVELSPDDYRRHSFLDDRLLQDTGSGHLVNWSDLERERPDGARIDMGWIFHIGHVGSTLISRLLGELEGVLPVREPRSLRDLTFFPPAVRASFVPALRALMSRTFAPDQVAIVKATSMVSEIAPELMGGTGRAVFLHASPQAYLGTILAGDSSPAQLQALSDFYSARAQRAALPIAPSDGDRSHIAALVWACEMAALELAAEQVEEERLLWLDFDSFLSSPTEQLARIAGFFGLEVGQDRLTQIVGGPVMSRYSKAPEYEFGPETRRQLLAQASRDHGPAINRALALLHEAAENAPRLARALRRSNLD